mgnify:CR=1 FL=1
MESKMVQQRLISIGQLTIVHFSIRILKEFEIAICASEDHANLSRQSRNLIY